MFKVLCDSWIIIFNSISLLCIFASLYPCPLQSTAKKIQHAKYLRVSFFDVKLTSFSTNENVEGATKEFTEVHQPSGKNVWKIQKLYYGRKKRSSAKSNWDLTKTVLVKPFHSQTNKKITNYAALGQQCDFNCNKRKETRQETIKWKHHKTINLQVNTLTHYSPVLFFYALWKHQKTLGFLIFLGGIEKQHRTVMG